MNNDTHHRAGFKPVLWFLFLTFAVTYGAEIAGILSGLRFDDPSYNTGPTLWLLGVMWIPGLAALIVTKFIEKANWTEMRSSLFLEFGPLRPYLRTIIIAPLAFGLMYGLTWLLGLSSPDLSMSKLTAMTGQETAITWQDIFYIMLPASMLIGPAINFAFGLGEELGWRGFLLPRLMVLGKTKAYLLVGTIWGLWHAPLILAGFNYPGHPIAGVAMMCILSSAFSLFLNEMTLRYRSVFLAAFIHAAINAQGYGIWHWLFPGTNPFFGGATGVTGIVVWLLIGFTTLKFFDSRPTN